MADLGPITLNLVVDKAAKRHATIVNSLQLPEVDSVALYVTAGIPNHRLVEVLEGFRWLSNGIRDRYLFPEPQLPGGNIYSGAPIDSMTENMRVTSNTSSLVFLPLHVCIGIHTSLRNPPPTDGKGARDHSIIIENAFKRLIEFARENEKFIAPGSYTPSNLTYGTAIDLASLLAPTGNTGTLTLDANRSDGFNVPQITVPLTNATIEEAHEALFKAIYQWEPRYLKYFETGQCYVLPHAEAAGHIDFNATWTPA